MRGVQASHQSQGAPGINSTQSENQFSGTVETTTRRQHMSGFSAQFDQLTINSNNAVVEIKINTKAEIDKLEKELFGKSSKDKIQLLVEKLNACDLTHRQRIEIYSERLATEVASQQDSNDRAYTEIAELVVNGLIVSTNLPITQAILKALTGRKAEGTASAAILLKASQGILHKQINALEEYFTDGKIDHSKEKQLWNKFTKIKIEFYAHNI